MIELTKEQKAKITKGVKRAVKNQAESIINTDDGWGDMNDAGWASVREELEGMGYTKNAIEEFIEKTDELTNFGVKVDVDFNLE